MSRKIAVATGHRRSPDARRACSRWRTERHPRHPVFWVIWRVMFELIPRYVRNDEGGVVGRCWFVTCRSCRRGGWQCQKRTRWTRTLVMTSSGSQSNGQNSIGGRCRLLTNDGCTMSALQGRFTSALLPSTFRDPPPIRQHRRLAALMASPLDAQRPTGRERGLCARRMTLLTRQVWPIKVFLIDPTCLKSLRFEIRQPSRHTSRRGGSSGH